MADQPLDEFIDFDADGFDLDELLNYDEYNPTNHRQVQEDVIGCPIDPMDDPFIQGLFEDGSGSDKPSGSESKDRNAGQNESFYVSEGFELWPVPAAPISCTFCLVLREIVHTNGICSAKLEIHGRVGMICHAISAIQISSGDRTHQMLDLSNKSMESVKEFLVLYCESRKQAGFVLVYDPMAPFYEALCVRLDLSDFYGKSDDESDLPTGPTDNPRLDLELADRAGSSGPKTQYQKQREKAANLTVEEVSGYFHLTLTKAAEELGVCATVVKRFCRRHGMPRWPYRKMKGFERKISDLREALLRTVDLNQHRGIEAEIARLGREIDEIYIRFRAS